VIAERGGHHAVGNPGMVVEPGSQVIDELGPGYGIFALDSDKQGGHALAGRIVATLVPTQRAVSGSAHQALFVGEVCSDPAGHSLGGLADLGPAAARQESFDLGERLEDIPVLVVDFGDEDSMRGGPLERGHGAILAAFGRQV